MNNILIIGNGFDIHHGANTRFCDFLDFYSGNNYNGYFGHRSFFDNYEYKNNVSGEIIKFSSIVSDNLWLKLSYYIRNNSSVELLNWADIEGLIGKTMYLLSKKYNSMVSIDTFRVNEYQKIIIDAFKYLDENINRVQSIVEIIKRLADDLNKLSFLLNKYLIFELERDKLEIDDNLKKIIVDYKYFERVISYNYTDVFCKLYTADVNCVYEPLHGELSDYNSMVFGTDIEPDFNKEADPVLFMGFQKYYQRIVKRSSLEYVDAYEKKIIDNCVFYGFSFSLSDKETIKYFIDKSKKVFIFIYQEKDLMNTVANLAMIYGKQEFVEINKNKINFIFNNNIDLLIESLN